MTKKLTRADLIAQHKERKQRDTTTLEDGTIVTVRILTADEVIEHSAKTSKLPITELEDGKVRIEDPVALLQLRREFVALAIEDDSEPGNIKSLYTGPQDPILVSLDLDQVIEQYNAVKEVNGMGGDLSIEEQIEELEAALARLHEKRQEEEETAKN